VARPNDSGHPSEPKRGFGSFTGDKLREIARRGGQAAQALGRAYKFTPEQARAAGRKGGLSVSQDRSHMAAIGQRGGQKFSPSPEQLEAARHLLADLRLTLAEVRRRTKVAPKTLYRYFPELKELRTKGRASGKDQPQ
jgi:general stress protein YciG